MTEHSKDMPPKVAKKKVKAKKTTTVIHNITNHAIFTGTTRIEPGKCLDIETGLANQLVESGLAEIVKGMS